MRITLLVTALALIALPAAALDPVIEHGSDIWFTRGDGTTFISFESDPLPADFFCTGSRPFAGQVVMQGRPLATIPLDVLGATDTIVQRLDPAVFDDNSRAVTRIQLSAIQLESVEPLRNGCGAFRIDMRLDDGPQPIGEMRIFRTSPTRGYYEADVSLDVRISFTPVGRDGQTLEVTRHIEFPTTHNFWASRPGDGGIEYGGFVQVDTDANGLADTFIPGTSRNFAPGWVGADEGTGILHRGAFSRSGPEVSGSLREGLPDLVPVTPALRNTEGAISEGCHSSGDGTHCQITPKIEEVYDL